jgi:phospholipid/cholesterol/gamma-HCH transport system permease protein
MVGAAPPCNTGATTRASRIRSRRAGGAEKRRRLCPDEDRAEHAPMAAREGPATPEPCPDVALEEAEIAFVGGDGPERTLRIGGKLDVEAVTIAWVKTLEALRSRLPRRLAIDGSRLTSCDGAGLGLLVELDRVVRGAGGTVEFRGLSPDLRSLLGRALLPPETAPHAPPPPSPIGRLGAVAARALADARYFVAFLGELMVALAWAATHPHRVRGGDVLLMAEKAGFDAVPVVSLIGGLMGLIIAFQGVSPLQYYGAVATIPTLLAVSLVRELGPLVTAIILAGRTGSALAAEIGTMKVTEEIDALSTLGLDPLRFLVVPRVLGTVLVTPFLSLFATFCGLVGGYIVMASLGYPLSFYVEQVSRATHAGDLLRGCAKGFAFAFLVAGIGCANGLKTGSGPGAVGASTTRAVVAGIVLIVVADGVFAFLGYVLWR